MMMTSSLTDNDEVHKCRISTSPRLQYVFLSAGCVRRTTTKKLRFESKSFKTTNSVDFENAPGGHKVHIRNYRYRLAFPRSLRRAKKLRSTQKKRHAKVLERRLAPLASARVFILDNVPELRVSSVAPRQKVSVPLSCLLPLV